jgi:hypothetical protein
MLAALAAAVLLALPGLAAARTPVHAGGHVGPGHHGLNAHVRWVTSSAWD